MEIGQMRICICICTRQRSARRAANAIRRLEPADGDNIPLALQRRPCWIGIPATSRSTLKHILPYYAFMIGLCMALLPALWAASRAFVRMGRCSEQLMATVMH